MPPRTPTLRSDDLLALITQIVENIPHMVFVKDAADLRFVLLNRAGEALLGHARDELLGKNDRDFFPPEQADFFAAKDREVLVSGEVLDIPEEPIETPAGRRWLHTKKVPLLGEDGRAHFLLGISEDITERRRIERMKDDLLSVASHELRSPTAAMIGTLRLLEARLGDQLDPASRETLTLAQENGERMMALLESCLDAERLEHEDRQLKVEPLDVDALLADALRYNQPFADRYSVRYRLQPVAAGLRVLADPDRLGQALANVLTNAAKFSPEGAEVEVEARALGAVVRMAVRDHGTGIPEAFQERVFDKFSRARSETSASHEGAGLGMRIAKQIVDRMGGRIGFESVEGQGTTFWIELPRAEPKA